MNRGSALMNCDKISWLQTNYPEAVLLGRVGACHEIPTGSNVHGVPHLSLCCFCLLDLDDVCLAEHKAV